MEKNIAALLDSKAYTIHVQYQSQSGNNTWTYVCNIPGIEVGDLVVVPVRMTRDMREKIAGRAVKWNSDYGNDSLPGAEEARGIVAALTNDQMRVTVAQVVMVDKEVEIPANDDQVYAWVMQKIDLLAYGATMARNKEIADSVQDAYKRRLRKSFSEQILGELADEDKARLLQLLN